MQQSRNGSGGKRRGKSFRADVCVLTSFLASLQVESTAEGEAQRYFDHALTLKNTILFLRYNRELTQDQGPDIPNIGTKSHVFLPFRHRNKTQDPAFPGAHVCAQSVELIMQSSPFSLHTRVPLGYAAL